MRDLPLMENYSSINKAPIGHIKIDKKYAEMIYDTQKHYSTPQFLIGFVMSEEKIVAAFLVPRHDKNLYCCFD